MVHTSRQTQTDHDVPAKDRIVETAERMFAEEGYKSVSLRSIARASDTNAASVHYYFGTKEALLEEIFARRCGEMNAERARRLEACRESPASPPLLEQLIAAYLHPTIADHAEDLDAAMFMRLRSRVACEQEQLARRLIATHFNAITRSFLDRIRPLLQHLSEREFFWRVHALLGVQHYTVANPVRIHDLSEGICDISDEKVALAHIVPFIAAGLRAPATAST